MKLNVISRIDSTSSANCLKANCSILQITIVKYEPLRNEVVEKYAPDQTDSNISTSFLLVS